MDNPQRGRGRRRTTHKSKLSFGRKRRNVDRTRGRFRSPDVGVSKEEADVDVETDSEASTEDVGDASNASRGDVGGADEPEPSTSKSSQGLKADKPAAEPSLSKSSQGSKRKAVPSETPLPVKRRRAEEISAGTEDPAAEKPTEGGEEEQQEPVQAKAEQEKQEKLRQTLDAFLETCCDDLTNRKTCKKLCMNLYQADALDDFMVLFNSLANGNFDPTNIAFTLCLERCRFQMLRSTTQMRYSKQSKLWWKLLYRETSGKAIRMASGPKNKGNVVRNIARRGSYDPKKSKTNFAVPSLEVLTTADPLEQALPDVMEPGLLLSSMDLLPEKSDIVLMGDGKALARGQLADGSGDVDLFGHEPPPTKKDLQRMMDVLRSNVENLRKNMTEDACIEMSHSISCLLESLQEKGYYFERRRKNMIRKYQKEGNEKSYTAGMSWVSAMDYRVRKAKEDMLGIIKHLCSLITHLRRIQPQFLAGETETSLFKLSNCKVLRPPEDLETDFDMERITSFVKPGSDLWYKNRAESYVTSDTLFQAIGLSTMQDMKEHFAVFVKDDSKDEDKKPACSADCLATVATRIVPVVYKQSGVVQEVGVHFKDSEGVIKILAATPDLMVATGGGNVPVIVTTKLPVQSPAFMVSEEAICRALCEMDVLGSKEALHIFFTKSMSVVHRIRFDEGLAEQLFQKVVDLFDTDMDNITPPKVASEITWKEEILGRLLAAKQSLCDFVCVVPSASRFTQDAPDQPEFTFPYYPAGPRERNELNQEELNSLLEQLLFDCDECLEDAHTVLRPQADEIFAILATDTDRMSSSQPSQVPVAYGLKGGSFTTEMLRGMMEEVKDELRSRDMNVVCEVFDGYHAPYMERDKFGEPLYASKLQGDVWRRFYKEGKKMLLHEIELLTSVESSVQKLAQLQNVEPSSDFVALGNIALTFTKEFPCPVKKREQGMFILSSLGGPLMEYGALDRLHSSTGSWFVSCEKKSLVNVGENIAEILIHTAVQPESREPASLVIQSLKVLEPLLSTHKSEIISRLLLQTPESLFNIVTTFKENLPEQLNRRVLAKLRDGDKLFKTYKVPELNAVANAVREATGLSLFPRDSLLKAQKASIISAFFGGNGKVQQLSLQPKTLKQLSQDEIWKPSYPKEQLQVALAEVYLPAEKKKWQAKYEDLGLPARIDISENRSYEFFSFPEVNQITGQFEPKVTDPYHILTNARKGATSGSYRELCDPQAWKDIVKNDTQKRRKLLTTSIVEDCVDKQSADLARRIFSEEVQTEMMQNGHTGTAEFVYHLRRWFEACDTRGISAQERVERLVDMHDYLTSGLSFDCFPAPVSYVKSIPIVTYEAILGNISTRLQLYSICQRKTYNQRSISTLAVENFFSRLANTSPTGCPRAATIPQVMAQVTSLDHYKHLSAEELGFHYEPQIKTVYPEHKVGEAGTNTVEESTLWKNHEFDRQPHPSKKSRYGKKSVTHDLKPLKGVRPVRANFYKIDESRLDTLRRMGLGPEDLLRFGIPTEWDEEEEAEDDQNV